MSLRVQRKLAFVLRLIFTSYGYEEIEVEQTSISVLGKGEKTFSYRDYADTKDGRSSLKDTFTTTRMMEDNLLLEEEYLMEGCISDDDGQPLKTIIDMKANGQKLISVPEEDEVLTRCEEEGRTKEELEFVEKWLAVDMEDKGHINFTDSVEEKKQIKITYSSGIKEERMQQ